jgi:RNA polymerase sigma-B factor
VLICPATAAPEEVLLLSVLEPTAPPVGTSRRRPPAVERQLLADRTRALLAELPAADPARRRDVVEEVVTSHLWLAEALARRITGHPGDREDLAQVACLALVEACLRFDPGQEVPFSAFATVTINGMLRHYLRDHTWTVRPPRPVQELALVLREQEPRLVQQLAGQPSADQLARALDDGTTEEEVRRAQLANRSVRGVPLDDPDHGLVAVDPTAEHSYEACELRILVERLLVGLEPEERELLRLRFVDEQSQSAIAARLHVNQMAVSRRLKRLMDRLRDQLADPAEPDGADLPG